jgi:hypothetical protein
MKGEEFILHGLTSINIKDKDFSTQVSWFHLDLAAEVRGGPLASNFIQQDFFPSSACIVAIRDFIFHNNLVYLPSSTEKEQP